MERTYELIFLHDSPPGHHWRDRGGDPWTPPSGAHDTDRPQHWKAGEVYSEFTHDAEKDGPFIPPFPIFGVRVQA